MTPVAAAVLAVLAASLAPRSAAQLPWARPPGCDPSTCSGCTEYRISTDNFTLDSGGSTQLPENPCGGDSAYFPVPIEYFANCAEWYPYAWRCVACCAAGCAPGACQWRGNGEYNATHGCSSCMAGAAPQILAVPATTCRSCFRSRKCGDEEPTQYRRCEERAPGQSVGEPPAQSEPTSPAPVPSEPTSPPAQPPGEARPRDLPSPPPQPPPPLPAAEPALEAPAPAPTPEADAPAPEPEAEAPDAAAAPAPAPALPVGRDERASDDVGAVPSLAAVPQPAAPLSAGTAAAHASLAALLLGAALAVMLF